MHTTPLQVFLVHTHIHTPCEPNASLDNALTCVQQAAADERASSPVEPDLGRPVAAHVAGCESRARAHRLRGLQGARSGGVHEGGFIVGQAAVGGDVAPPVTPQRPNGWQIKRGNDRCEVVNVQRDMTLTRWVCSHVNRVARLHPPLKPMH